jgi:hypothetical protein
MVAFGTFLSHSAKALAALVGSLATWGVAAGADGHYTQVELWGLLAVVATTVGTYYVTNQPKE